MDASRAWKKTSGFWAVPRTTGASGCQAASPERDDIFIANERPDIGLIEHGDLVDLVRGPEPVEEVEERDPGTERRGMRDQREVMRFLDRARREHRPTGRAGVHDVAVVAEDREGMRRDRPGRDMDHRRRQLAGDLEHVGDHQKQALRGREGGGQRALLECPVEGSGRTRLGLHLDDVGHLAPQIGPTCGGPIVAVLGHGGSGGDRVDRDDFADGIGDASCRLVAVQALDALVHVRALRVGERPIGPSVQPCSMDRLWNGDPDRTQGHRSCRKTAEVPKPRCDPPPGHGACRPALTIGRWARLLGVSRHSRQPARRGFLWADRASGHACA